MSSWHLSSSAVRLLAVLYVTAGCEVTQQQQQQPSEVQLQLRTLESRISDLERRLDAIDDPEKNTKPLENKLEATVNDIIDRRMEAIFSRTEHLAYGWTGGRGRVDGWIGGRDENGQTSQTGSYDQGNNREEKDRTAGTADELVVEGDGEGDAEPKADDDADDPEPWLDGATNETASQQTESSEVIRLDQEGQATTCHPRDCSDLPAGATTGVYHISAGDGRSQSSTKAFCDMDTDGGNWTVFQRRDDIKPRQDFYLGWAEYKHGFGNLTGEFWWGLDYLWRLTSVQDRQYELRIDLEDFGGRKRYTVYQDFKISPEADGYRLSASNFTGNAARGLLGSVGMKFSTWDRDQDELSGVSCVERHRGAWWHRYCSHSNLNGRYMDRESDDHATGIWWWMWKGFESLKRAELKIRPT